MKSERELNLPVEKLLSALLFLSENETVCLLDSCGASHLGSRLFIAGIEPVETLELNDDDAEKTLKRLDDKFSQKNLAFIFTLSYDFGLKIEKIERGEKFLTDLREPDAFLAAFDCLIIYDYESKKTKLVGDAKKFDRAEKKISEALENNFNYDIELTEKSLITSNFSREEYLLAVEKIKAFIKRGDTYQTNLTQQFQARLAENLTPQQIFYRLRKSHPAPFAAFLKRNRDSVVSISPERFFYVENSIVSASPIKGTRPRGKNSAEDARLKNELLESRKDRAENTMIVDLLRNDIGKICRFGSVKAAKICDLETHPTFFNLVSTVEGELPPNTKFSEMIRAVFPCGSITGAPKIRTMRIIEEIETVNRGLSMGAIGYFIPNSKFQIPNLKTLDLSVAIRTLTISGYSAVFNVGGGIVAGSNPQEEYEETLVKAAAIFKAINGELKI